MSKTWKIQIINSNDKNMTMDHTDMKQIINYKISVASKFEAFT